jgi:transposase
MAPHADSLPTDLAAAHALILAQREALVVAEAKAAAAESVAKSRALEIEQLKYQIAKLKHEQYGQSSERSTVLEQLELKLSELGKMRRKPRRRRSLPHSARRSRSRASSGASRRAVRCPSICRASASSIRLHRPARAAAAACTSSART